MLLMESKLDALVHLVHWVNCLITVSRVLFVYPTADLSGYFFRDTSTYTNIQLTQAAML